MKDSTQLKNYTCSSDTSLKGQEKVSIEILSGKHESTVLLYPDKEFVLLGTGDACDLILSDARVEPKHCMINHVDGSWMLRALEGEVKVEGKVVPIAGNAEFSLGDQIEIGECTIRMIDTTKGKSEPDSIEQGSWLVEIYREHHKRFGAVGLFLTMTSALLMSWLYTGSNNAGAQESVSPVLAHTLAGDTSNHSLVSNDREAHQKQLVTSVTEVLRLSGIDVKARLLNPGTVEISGYFDNEDVLHQVLKSRAIVEIKGLEKVIPVNLSKRTEQQKDIDSGKQIVRIVNQDNGYVVTKDGSVYFLGSILPNGATLIAIKDNEVVLKTDQGEHRVSGANAFALN